MTDVHTDPVTTSPTLPRMRRLRLLYAALAGAALSAALPVTAPAQTGVASAMSCLAQTDAAGIDAMLARAGSPLAGEGATFVAEGTAAGIDPRALVAIAAHETILETYVPSQAIHNPFGLGPGIAFASDADAISRAARTLGSYYVPEGRVTLGSIGAKWAPIGVANDPDGLNAGWTAGVGAYYSALGGDPSRAILTTAQDGVPACLGAPSLTPPVEAAEAPAGPPVVTAWGGAAPVASGGAARDGADPATGEPAVLEGFVFPLALAQGAPAAYRDSYSEPGATDCDGGRHQCAVTIATAPGTTAVAMVAGTLRGAEPAEAERGIAFWIETPTGDRLGYGPLASYAEGVGHGASVTAGQPLGAVAGWVRIAWERGGSPLNPYPLLAATRPPSG